jgi:hypothetical protein
MDYTKLLFDKYGTINLKTEHVSEIIDRSVASLEADRRKNEGIQFIRVGGKPNSPVRYPLHEVSNYLNSVEKVYKS